MNRPRRIAEAVARHGAVIGITVIRAEGSTPREVGAAMLVGPVGIEGTIGGGAMENQAIAHARTLLADAGDMPWHRESRDFALGPSLGQCCGGAVRLLFERFTRREWPALADIGRSGEPEHTVLIRAAEAGAPPQAAVRNQTDARWPPAIARLLREWAEDAPAPGPVLIPGRKGGPDWFVEPLADAALPLVLHGAGHVGRALVRALDGLPFRITWVDGRADAFPQAVSPLIVVRDGGMMDPAPLMQTLPGQAIHIVMTHSHPLDLAICHAVLARDDFRFLGLIGSQTKRARFLKRLREMGIGDGQLERLVCPIGLPGIAGKQPAVIAIAVAAQLLQIVSRPPSA